jgi:hypothetical protein
MSNSSVSRYDKYIPLFSQAGDRRVRLWLHTIESQNKSSQNGHAPNLCNNVDVMIRHVNGKVPTALDKGSFETKSLGLEDVHSEWADFFADVDEHFKRPPSLSLQKTPLQYNLLKSLVGACQRASNNLLEMVVYKLLEEIYNQSGQSGLFNLVANDKPIQFSNVDIKKITLEQSLKLPIGTPRTGKRFFSISLNRFTVKNFLDEAANQPQSLLPASTKIFDGALSVEDEYFRNADGRLLKKDVNAPGGKRHVGNEDIEKLNWVSTTQ